MNGLSGFLSAMAGAADAFPKGRFGRDTSLSNLAYSDTGQVRFPELMQRGIGQLPQAPQQIQAPNLYEYWRLLGEGKPVAFNRPDPLAALRAARIPFMGL